MCLFHSKQKGNIMKNCTKKQFIKAFNKASLLNPMIKQMCSTPERGKFYIGKGYGFAIDKGELLYVFSSVKGKGDIIMQYAIKKGARLLDCFDGYLVDFYTRYGFKEYKRELNWTKGEADIVYMERV